MSVMLLLKASKTKTKKAITEWKQLTISSDLYSYYLNIYKWHKETRLCTLTMTLTTSPSKHSLFGVFHFKFCHLLQSLTYLRSYNKGSIIKCCAETILNIILRSSLKYAYVWLIEWTYAQKRHKRLSFKCEIYESWKILNLRGATEWVQLSAL